MRAHAEDLRAEVQDLPRGEEMVEAVSRDYRQAELPAAERAMLDFAVKLTLTPAEMSAEDVAALRRHGFGDTAIHDVVQTTALFNYYNRLADGLGIDMEEDW